MGISGLLPLLKDIQVQGNISAFKGQRLAVDAYVWLHKGAFGCAEDLVKGKKTTRFVDYAMHRVRLLRHHGIAPFIVFDGGPLPAKKGTENSRAKSRAEHLAKAESLESQGRLKEARDAYTKCVDITPEMAFQLIKALRAENVDYVVAPYEADAQLCFLEREGFVDGIITEDSDLLVFGCKQVIFKLDGNGQCISIHRDKLATVRDFPMHGWTDVQFRRMAMLSGCDYLPSIPGMGLKTAHRLLRRHKTVEKLLTMVRLDGVMIVPPDYIASFAQAELAFIHQRVFDPEAKRLVPLNDFPPGGLKADDEKWIGLDLDVDTARGLATGDLHPETLLPIEDQWPDFKPVAPKSALSFGNSNKIVLGESSKANFVAGPMDAFISRKRNVLRAPLVKPVGVFGSGVSRLSDQPSLARDRLSAELERAKAERAGPDMAARTTRSKFFQTCKTEDIEAVELVWEKSDDPPDIEGNTPVAGPSRLSRSPACDEEEYVRSPSPVVSSLREENSPATSLPQVDDYHLTSPARDTYSSAPAVLGVTRSSPALSSPASLDPFSPPQKLRRSRTASPVSPTRSPPLRTAAFLDSQSHLTQMIPTSQVQQEHTPTKKRRRHDSMPSPIERDFVPESSPPADLDFPRMTARVEERVRRGTRRRNAHSSDSIEEEQVMTPSAADSGKRKSEEEVMEEEQEKRRQERTKVVAAGWRNKYAVNTNVRSFPSPGAATRPTPKRIKSDTPTSWPSRQQPVRADTIPGALVERPINIVSGPVAELKTPMAAEKKVRSPLSALDPQKVNCNSLERFRFAGKVTMDYKAVL